MRPPARLAAAALVLAVAFAAAGCGGEAKTVTVTRTTPSAEVAPAEPSTEPAEEPTQSETPNISAAITRAWPRRWCEVKIGDPRKEVTEIMHSSPTQEDSNKIPLIPPIHTNAQGEDKKVTQPPQPAGSDTWAAPLAGEYDAFYNDSLRVQQLDFDGQASKLPCSPIRT